MKVNALSLVKNRSCKDDRGQCYPDVFLGRELNSGKVAKIRSVGYVKTYGANRFEHIFFKAPFLAEYLLLPIIYSNENVDLYIINSVSFCFGRVQDHTSINDLDIVGTGKIQSGINLGLVHLKIDLSITDNIYLKMDSDDIASKYSMAV